MNDDLRATADTKRLARSWLCCGVNVRRVGGHVLLAISLYLLLYQLITKGIKLSGNCCVVSWGGFLYTITMTGSPVDPET